MHPLSLDHVTIVSVTPPELVRIAGLCGCVMVNLKTNPGHSSLEFAHDFNGDKAMQRETRQRAADLGIEIGIAESFAMHPEVKMSEFDRGLEAAAAIGARYVNTHGQDPDRQRQMDSFQAFCEHATSFGLGVTLEYFRRSQANSLEKALELVRSTPRATIMVDTLHVVRCGTDIKELAAVEPERVGWVQFNDGPLVNDPVSMETEGRYNRQIPGEGTFPLRDIVAALPPDVPIGCEVPSKPAMDAGTKPEDWARKVVTASRQLLESFGTPLRTR